MYFLQRACFHVSARSTPGLRLTIIGLLRPDFFPLPADCMDQLIAFLRSFDTRHYLIAAAVWTMGIIAALTIPVPGLPKIDPSLTLDKVAHVVLFAGFAVFWMRALRPDDQGHETEQWAVPWRQTLVVTGAGIAFAIGSEFYQMLLPFKRTADPYDALADIIGLVLGLSAYLLYRYNMSVSEQASGP